MRHAVSTGNQFGAPGSSSSSDSNPEPQQGIPEEPTLYKILGAAMTDSRSELKKKYVALAKQSHPDVLRNTNTNSVGMGAGEKQQQQQYDFTEIAAAWRILSDPAQRKRYDRTLRAEQLAEDIAAFVGRRAGPVTEGGAALFEKVALPFLRRTTATTLASFQAAFQENKDITKSFQSAMEAAQHAGRAVDQMEWLERAEQLERTAVEEYKKVVELQNELSRKAEERLKMSLHTTKSGITSAEAMIVLENFNQTLKQVSPSVWERANPLRCSVEQEISSLQFLEDLFVKQQQTDAYAQAKYRATVKERMVAQNELEQAEAEEERARQVYEAAIVEAAQKRKKAGVIQSELHYSEQAAQTSSSELESLSETVLRQSEAVRHALRRKERNVYKHHQKGSVSLQPPQQRDNSFAAFAQHYGYEMSETTLKDMTTSPEFTQPVTQEPYQIIPDCDTAEENEARVRELSIRRQEERALAEQVHRMEVNAARLLSRANKLKMQAANNPIKR